MKFDSARSVLLTLIVSIGLIGCSDPDTVRSSEALENSADEPYTIVCTIGMITDIVRNVAGNHAKVEGIIGEGVDPHLYKPTRSDVVNLNDADVVFYNGLLLEGKMTDILERVANPDKPVRALAESILKNANYSLHLENDSGHTDPHVWMDVRGWMLGVEVVAETLSAFDPLNEKVYRENALDYIQKLDALDGYAKQSIASIPESQRALVTAHDAFGYLGKATGLTVKGIQGISTESEAGLRDVEELIDFIIERGVPAIFSESSVADKNVRALVEGAKARGHELKVGGMLFSDAMGRSGTYEGTYIGMIDHNVTTITRALGGKADEEGMQGKLSGVSH